MITFKTQLVVLPLLALQMFSTVDAFHREIPQPVRISKEDTRLTEIRQALRILGRDEKYANDLFLSAQVAKMDPVKWACNIETESNFKIDAKSNKNYKGLGQTPKAVMKTGYEVGDLVYAACIYNDKLKFTKGDHHLALAMYKGGNNPAAHKCANKVEDLYAKVKSKINEENKLKEKV